MKYLFLSVMMLVCSSVYAGDCCSASPKEKAKVSCVCGKTCECDPCECRHVPLKQRVWVEDVYAPGVWYFGYYVPVGDSYEFCYQRREVRGALSNFNSIVWVNYKHNLRLAKRPVVKVIYKP